MRTQSRQAIKAIAENERRKLKAQMYEDSVEVIQGLVDAVISLSTLLRSAAMELELAAKAHSAGLGYPFPQTRWEHFIPLYREFSDAALRLVFLVENRRIIDPRILVFRTALNTCLHETRDLMFWKMSMNVAPLLPHENAAGEPFPYEAPSTEAAEAAKSLTEQFCDVLTDVTSYTEDFLVELQNHLLGDLFQNRIEHRKPLDPNKKVVTLAEADELEVWFTENTSWGQEMTRVMSETRIKFKPA